MKKNCIFGEFVYQVYAIEIFIFFDIIEFMNKKNVILSAKFSDIRAISNAHIEINGITAMCGPNGCGKSTISKLLFGYLYTDINFKQIVRKKYFYKFYKYTDLLNSICHNEVLDIFPRDYTVSMTNEFWDDIFTKVRTYKEIEKSLGKKTTKTSLLRYNKIFSEILEEKCSVNSVEELIDRIQEAIYNLISEINEIIEKRNVSYLDSFYTQIFEEKNQNWKYQFYEYGDTLLNKNTMEKQHSFSKVIYIDMTETSLDDSYRNNRYRADFRWKISDTVRDYLVYRNSDNIPDEKLLELFKSIMKGTVTQQNINSDFVFTSENGEVYNLSQCATGLKSFAILEMLCKKGHFDQDTLVIIDEPEVHLHPQWVIEYARLLILINKIVGTKFLLATHNPDFVSSLKSISEKEKTNVCFYLGSKNENKYDFKNLGTNIEPIFESFNIALERIYEYSDLE